MQFHDVPSSRTARGNLVHSLEGVSAGRCCYPIANCQAARRPSRASRFLWTAFCEQENELCPRENSTRLGPRREPGEASASSALVGTGRWSARRKVSVVIEWLKGESLEGLSRRHGVTAAKLSQWRGEFLAGGEARLKHRETPIEDEDTRRLKSVVADLATDKALLVEKIRHLEVGRPLGWWRSKR